MDRKKRGQKAKIEKAGVEIPKREGFKTSAGETKEYKHFDRLDSEIIEMLVNDPKIGISKIAHSAGCSELVVSYRMNRLKDKGIIKSFNAIANMNYLGFEHYKVFFKLKKVDPDSVRRVTEFFESCWGIYEAATLGGKYDLFVTIFVRNYMDYDNFIDSCYSHFPDIIGEIDDVYVKTYYVYPLKYVLPEGFDASRRISIPVSYETVQIDETDKSILKSLSQNCRLSSIDIADITKINYKTILYRIKSLEQRKIISGHKTLIDDKVHKPYLVVFSLSAYYKESETKMFGYLSAHPLVSAATKQFGKWQLLVHLYAKDENEVKTFITQFRENFQNVRDYEVLPIISFDYMNMFPYY